MSAGGAAGAAAAAAAKRRQDEEEEMTRYTSEELNEGWEFKILRSHLGGFRSPEKLRTILAEEAKAGWELVEKFDNERVRLKRPAKARNHDHELEPDFDPYRSQVGPSDGKIALIVIGVVLGSILLLALLVSAMR